jgi:hypothetical protein
MRRDELIICAAHLLVKLDVWSTTEAAALRVLMEDSADEERVISNMRPKQERLLGSSAA